MTTTVSPSGSVGPYRILEVLGQGGMGVVYLAEHGTSGRQVALKTVVVRKKWMLANIRREIHALARLRHPGIVRILDFGQAGGVPWYAMEVLQGTPLSDHRDDLWREAYEREERPRVAAGRLGEVLTVVRRLCEPLRFLHGEGVVHRDLKPENVLMRPDGWPVLVDFGLVARVTAASSRDALAFDEVIAGTFDYMAPEQARGEVVDARADLYSLGCILYELLTGQRPASAEPTAPSERAAAPAAEPLPPSRLVIGVPGALDALVMRLLARDARARLGFADDVAKALVGMGAAAEGHPEHPRPRPYLYRPALAGRAGSLQQFFKHFMRMGAGQGSLVLIGGESGMGKTRLAMEVAAQAWQLGFRVMTGECAAPPPDHPAGAPGVGGPLMPFRRLLVAVADQCLERGAAEAARLLGEGAPILSPYAPELGRLPGASAGKPPVPLDPEAALLRVFHTLSATLRTLAGDDPLMIVLDDLQWADGLTLSFLEYLGRSAGLDGVRMLILGTYRSDEVGEALRRLLQAPAIHVSRLGRLDPGAVTGMAGDMLGHNAIPQTLAAYLLAQAGGNPFFVGEYLRAAVADGVLHRDDDGAWQMAPGAAALFARPASRLPETIEMLVNKRLDGLSAGAASIVGAAAVIGRDVDVALLSLAAASSESQVLDAEAELLARQVMEQAIDGSLRFAHAQIRDVAYDRIPAEERRGLHHRVAEALTAGAERENLGEAAAHWERAGETDRARPLYLGAARLASSRHALREAARLYRAYLALSAAPDPERLGARQELAETLSLSGDTLGAVGEHEVATAEASGLGDRGAEARHLSSMALLLQRLGRMEEAGRLHDRALAIAREDGDRHAECRSLQMLGMLMQDLGRMEEGRTCLEHALDLSRELGDRAQEAMALANLANLHNQQRRTDGARAMYEAAIEIVRQRGDRRSEALNLGNLATLHHEEGRLPQAEQLYQQALALARELGDLPFEGMVLGNVGICFHQRGELDVAESHYEQALHLAREASDARAEASSLVQIATLHRDRGELHRAQEAAEQAVDILRRVRDRRLEGAALCLLAAILRQGDGDLGVASRYLKASRLALTEVGDALELAKCRCEEGHLAIARGEDGSRRLAQARELARSLGVRPESELGAMVAALARAVAASTGAGGATSAIHRGQLQSDLPPGLRAALEERGASPEGVRTPGEPR